MQLSGASSSPAEAEWMRLRLVADPEAATASRQAVTQFALQSGAVGQIVTDIALAVSEAVSNVVLHAYRDLPRPGIVSVEADRHGDALRIFVRDDGPGIAPRANSPGLGLGLSIIACVTRALEIRSRPEGGAELCMIFDLA